MLSITPQAAEAIRGIMASENVPDEAVLRISSQTGPDAEAGFAISVTDSPPDGDQVVQEQEVELCIEPEAAQMLDDKELDATVSGGQVNFSLSDQAA